MLNYIDCELSLKNYSVVNGTYEPCNGRMCTETSSNIPCLIWYFNSGKRNGLGFLFFLNWRGEKTLHSKVLSKSYFNIPPFVSWRTCSLSKYRCSIKSKNHKFVSEEAGVCVGGWIKKWQKGTNPLLYRFCYQNLLNFRISSREGTSLKF